MLLAGAALAVVVNDTQTWGATRIEGSVKKVSHVL